MSTTLGGRADRGPGMTQPLPPAEEASRASGFHGLRLLTDSQNNGRTDRLLPAIVLLAVPGKLSAALPGDFEKRAVKTWA